MYIGIDLSTKTGIVQIGEYGNVQLAKEITSNKKDPERMIEIVESITEIIEPNSKIAIEGFSYGSRGRGMSFQFGLGYALRIELCKRNIPFLIVTPSQVKKYATGKGNTSKDNMILPIYRNWGFEHNSDNVRDAYVLARIMYDMEMGANFEYQKSILADLQE